MVLTSPAINTRQPIGLPAGVVLPTGMMVGGLGWIGGVFRWSGPVWPGGVLVTLAHLLPILVTLLAARALADPGHARAGRVVLTVLASCIKATTIIAIISLATDGGFAPHQPLDWVAIGMANAGSGLWVLHLIRSARAVR